MKTEAEIRAEHPDWTPEQVAAEVARLSATPPAPPEPVKPEPPKQDPEVDRAMAEMRRKLAAAEADAKTLRDADAERERKRLEDEGNWKALAEKAEADKAALQARIDEGERKAAASQAKAAGVTYASSVTPERGAFSDPAYALYRVGDNGTDMTDVSAVKAALDALATAQPSLLTAPPPSLPSGGPPSPNAQPPAVTLTREKLLSMSPEDIRKIPAAERQAVLSGP